MLTLTSPYKIVTLPINCDTLLLTLSPHYEVAHHHCYSLQQTGQILKKYQQTHRVCLVADTYEKGIEACKAIKEIINNEDKQIKSTSFIEMTTLKLLPYNVQESKQNSSILPNLKSRVNKIEQQIQLLSKEIVKQRLQGQNKKCKSKNLKIKQKRLDQLQLTKQNLKKQLEDRDWLEKSRLEKQQDENLLLWMKEFEQEQQQELLESL